MTKLNIDTIDTACLLMAAQFDQGGEIAKRYWNNRDDLNRLDLVCIQAVAFQAGQQYAASTGQGTEAQ